MRLCVRALVPLLLALAASACGGGQQTAESNWTAEAPEKVRPLRETEALNAVRAAPSEKAMTMIGVRHDLMLSNEAHATKCSCLAAEVGSPGESKFFWTGGPQNVGPDALVIAIGARGVSCQGLGIDEARRRPSISAVEQSNDDIIVEIEDLPETRPLAQGAIIPKPGINGAIFIRPRDSSVPYGHSGPGRSLCKVR